MTGKLKSYQITFNIQPSGNINFIYNGIDRISNPMSPSHKDARTNPVTVICEMWTTDVKKLRRFLDTIAAGGQIKDPDIRKIK